mmetsp:Transcript_26617/g.86158  ORF Transcript_26617/g.86158 Transcript_26617/m.86158 type:complete len:129 (+) Transcript_26617:75-461(+)
MAQEAVLFKIQKGVGPSHMEVCETHAIEVYCGQHANFQTEQNAKAMLMALEMGSFGAVWTVLPHSWGVESVACLLWASFVRDFFFVVWEFLSFFGGEVDGSSSEKKYSDLLFLSHPERITGSATRRPW